MEEITEICSERKLNLMNPDLLTAAYTMIIREKYGPSETSIEDLIAKHYPSFYLAIKEAYHERKNAEDQSFNLLVEWSCWKDELNQLKLHLKVPIYQQLCRTIVVTQSGYDVIIALSDEFKNIVKYIPSLLTYISFNNICAASMVMSTEMCLKGLSRELLSESSFLFLTRWLKKWPQVYTLPYDEVNFFINNLLYNKLYLVALVFTYLRNAPLEPILLRLMDRIDDITGWLKTIEPPDNVDLKLPILTQSEENVRRSSPETWTAFRSIVGQYEDRRSDTTKEACGKLDVWDLVLTELDAISSKEDHVELYDTLLKNETVISYNYLFKEFLDRYPVLVELLSLRGCPEIKKMNAGLGRGEDVLKPTEWGYIFSAEAAIRYAKQENAMFGNRLSVGAELQKHYLMYPFQLLQSYGVPLTASSIDQILLKTADEGIKTIVDSIKYWFRSNLYEELIDLYVDYLKKGKDTTLLLILVNQTAEIYDLNKMASYLFERLKDLYERTKLVDELIISLKKFIGTLDDVVRTEKGPYTSQAVLQACFLAALMSEGNFAMNIAERLIDTKWKLNIRSLITVAYSGRLDRFSLLARMDIDTKNLVQLYQEVFDGSPQTLAYLLSVNRWPMVSTPSFDIELSKNQLASIQILLTHPNTPPSIRNDPILLERQYG